jgi:hypothetical protein
MDQMSDVPAYDAPRLQLMRNFYSGKQPWNANKSSPIKQPVRNMRRFINGTSTVNIRPMTQAVYTETNTDAEEIRLPRALLVCFGLSILLALIGFITALISIPAGIFSLGILGLSLSLFGLLGISVTIEMAKRRTAGI